MKAACRFGWLFVAFQCLLHVSFLTTHAKAQSNESDKAKRFLYVAVPGVRNYLEYGGHGVLIFDIEDEHRFVRRIATQGTDPQGKPWNVKGICANATTQRLYVSTIKSLMCLDLATDKLLWERQYEGGCDRMAISPDGTHLYLPSLESAHWHVVDGEQGNIIATLKPDSGAHNTLYGSDGKWAYLAGLRSPFLTVADTKTHAISRQIGPFSAPIRPFTIDGLQTRCYVCLNELLGFEIGAITTGEKLARVEVKGFKQGPVKRHGCPSHGIALTPDETEIWVVDAHNQQLHVFDNTQLPPTQIESIALRDEPGWITFSIDGKYAYPSTGEVIESKTRRIVTQLKDESDALVQSEKMLEIQFTGATPSAVGNQFGIGRKVK